MLKLGQDPTSAKKIGNLSLLAGEDYATEAIEFCAEIDAISVCLLNSKI